MNRGISWGSGGRRGGIDLNLGKRDSNWTAVGTPSVYKGGDIIFFVGRKSLVSARNVWHSPQSVITLLFIPGAREYELDFGRGWIDIPGASQVQHGQHMRSNHVYLVGYEPLL